VGTGTTSATASRRGRRPTLRYAKKNFAACDAYPEGGVKRVQVLSGSDAQIAADGQVAVTFKENGDDVSLDRAVLIVTFA
jgi:hypothetical protein